MEEFNLPRSTLDRLPTAMLKGVFVALLERADENGVATLSVRALAKELGVGYQPMRTALKNIYANALANAVPNAKLTQQLTQITICDIESYTTPLRKRQRKANAGANAEPNAATAPQNRTKFIPPTEQEVKDYVNEKGYHFNPEGFVPFYQSKDWKIGGQPMKDWQAACSTWEIRWKSKYGEQFYYQIGKHNVPGQADRYTDLEQATETVLRQPGNIDAYFNDRGLHP